MYIAAESTNRAAGRENGVLDRGLEGRRREEEVTEGRMRGASALYRAAGVGPGSTASHQHTSRVFVFLFAGLDSRLCLLRCFGGHGWSG